MWQLWKNGFPKMFVTSSRHGSPTSNAPFVLWQHSRRFSRSFKLVIEGIKRILVDSLRYLPALSTKAANGASHSGPSGTMSTSSPSSTLSMGPKMLRYKRLKELFVQRADCPISSDSLRGVNSFLSLYTQRPRMSFSFRQFFINRSIKSAAFSFCTSFCLKWALFPLAESAHRLILLCSSDTKTVLVDEQLTTPEISSPASGFSEGGDCRPKRNFIKSSKACALPCSAAHKASSNSERLTRVVYRAVYTFVVHITKA